MQPMIKMTVALATRAQTGTSHRGWMLPMNLDPMIALSRANDQVSRAVTSTHALRAKHAMQRRSIMKIVAATPDLVA